MQNSSGTVKIPAEFIEVHMRKLNSSSIRTFLFLCGAAGDGWDVSVSIPAIAEGAGFTERVTIEALKNLEEKGLLRRERQGGANANRYRLLPQDGKGARPAAPAPKPRVAGDDIPTLVRRITGVGPDSSSLQQLEEIAGKDKERLRRALQKMVTEKRQLDLRNLASAVDYLLRGGRVL